MTQPSIVVVVPLPPKELHPNARVHWAKKARAVKMARRNACGAAQLVTFARGMTSWEPKWQAASVAAVFFVKDKRGTIADADGRISSLKATMDGIADAGVIANDRGFEWKSIEHRIDKSNPRVEVTITKLEPSRPSKESDHA